ncbi:hypothetical protein [Rhabdothermincola salaria]|nr:hypothetical protein [Rhabdothermincola salaria]
MIAEATAELDLSGVSSADIVMAGSGPGQTENAYRFELADVTF